MRERRHLDRTDHARAAENRRRQSRMPPESAIQDALSAVEDHEVPGTPPVSALKVLDRLRPDERETETRRVEGISITTGRPQSGVHRSDDHVGRYTAELPAAQVSSDAYAPDECRECGHDRVTYSYHANHYIAGGEGIECAECGTALYGDEWG